MFYFNNRIKIKINKFNNNNNNVVQQSFLHYKIIQLFKQLNILFLLELLHMLYIKLVKENNGGIKRKKELWEKIDLFYFILFYFILFYFILFYFILFYFILFYFILFYFN